MAAPNIAGLTSIIGKTNVLSITTTATPILINSLASGKVLKVNSLVISNVNGLNSSDITIDLYRNNVAYRLSYLIAVSPKFTLIAIGKDIPIYLEEGDSLRLTAGDNDYLEGIVSYEEIM